MRVSIKPFVNFFAPVLSTRILNIDSFFGLRRRLWKKLLHISMINKLQIFSVLANCDPVQSSAVCTRLLWRLGLVQHKAELRARSRIEMQQQDPSGCIAVGILSVF